MQKVGSLALTLLLVLGLLGTGLSVCRSFMDPDCVTQLVGASQDPDQCRKMCQFGQDESLAVIEKAQSQSSFSTPIVLAEHVMLPRVPHVQLIHRTTKVEVDKTLPPGEVYLLNASFLI